MSPLSRQEDEEERGGYRRVRTTMKFISMTVSSSRSLTSPQAQRTEQDLPEDFLEEEAADEEEKAESENMDEPSLEGERGVGGGAVDFQMETEETVEEGPIDDESEPKEEQEESDIPEGEEQQPSSDDCMS